MAVHAVHRMEEASLGSERLRNNFCNGEEIFIDDEFIPEESIIYFN